MKLSEFDYNFSKDMIAVFPAEQRDNSRLMVLKRNEGLVRERIFSELGEYLDKNDVLALNDTRVIPARLIGSREATGGEVEILLLERLSDTRWKTLVRPARGARVGARVSFNHGRLRADIVGRDEEGRAEVTFEFEGDFMDALEELGRLPLPPYIKREPEPTDSDRYQTVYARRDGSIAAPTAGLHFTKGLLERLEAKGVRVAYLTLHINYATFKPVVSDDITTHKMYEEYFELSEEAASVINNSRKEGGRVVAVGTSVCRVLEHTAHKVRRRYSVRAMKGWTDLFIYPPYKFKIVDALVTNFHMPKTTLLMLVSAFSGKGLLFEAYKKAVEKKYRFFSYGDAMLII